MSSRKDYLYYMKLLSIFVGKPRELDYNGRFVATGIYKEEINGPVQVHFLNIAGDQQADLTVHGGPDKAVYVYPSEHYSFWKEKRSDLFFQPGIFGENLSTTGLDEATCVGDVFKIGTAIFRVTNPRMPCFKLGIKMNDPKFIKDFMDARKNGFYLRVLQEGEIKPGDMIEKMEEDGHGLTIDEVIQLYTTKKEDEELLIKSVGAPNLPEDRREYFEKKLDQLRG